MLVFMSQLFLSEEELKSLLVKVESEKVGLKLNIQKTKIMASGPITSCQIDGETEETVADFILGDSKITADADFSHAIKRHLLLGRKVMINLDGILKSRDITPPTKVRLVKAMVFPVCREPARDIPPMTRTSGEAWWARRVRSQGVLCLSICPETKICLFTVHYTILF